jgi:hypothetical protein
MAIIVRITVLLITVDRVVEKRMKMRGRRGGAESLQRRDAKRSARVCAVDFGRKQECLRYGS